MFGLYPDDSNNPKLQAMRQEADTLEELVQLLSIMVTYEEILTWQIIRDRYPYTGLTKRAQDAIAQSLRIIRATGKHAQIGLWEFHIGLIYLHWDEPQIALDHFVTAKQHWTFISFSTGVCLALFAQGCMQHFTYKYEDAMINYHRTQNKLDNLKNPINPHNNSEFVTILEDALTKARDSLRGILWQTENLDHDSTADAWPSSSTNTENADTDPIKLPVINMEQSQSANKYARPRDTKPPIGTIPPTSSYSPIPDHRKENDQMTWYKIQGRHDDNFLPGVERDDWVLVKKSVTNDITHNDLVLIDDINLNSSIWLRLSNEESVDPTARPRISLVRVTEDPQIFYKDSSGQFQLSRVQISERQTGASIDIEKIIGIVLGIWVAKIKS